MVTLGNPKSTIEIVQKCQFAFQKRFGQNFLTDTRVLDKIISTAGTAGDDCVLGIGPGIGAMTQCLAEHAGKVVAVGVDTNLLPTLDGTLESYSNVAVINSSTLELDANKLVGEYSDRGPIKVVVNLPYYVTTFIIMGLFESNVPIDNITVMVQKEVADRMQVGPGSKDYDVLSLTVQYYAKPYIMINVPPSCFIPHSNVSPVAIHLTRYQEPPVQVGGPGIVFCLIRTSSNQRRKTLRGGLNNSPEVPYTKGQIVSAIESLEVPTSTRGGTLTLEQFASLASYFIRVAGKETSSL